MLLLVFLIFGISGVVVYLLAKLFFSETKKAANDVIDFVASKEAHQPLKWWQIVLGFLLAFYCMYLCFKYNL